MMVGNTFAHAGYGIAFGLDSTAFVAFSHVIMDLKENGNLTAIFEHDDYKLGHQAEDELNDLCGGVQESVEFEYDEFIGLQIIFGGFAFLAFLVHFAERLLRGGGLNNLKVADSLPGPAKPAVAPLAFDENAADAYAAKAKAGGGPRKRGRFSRALSRATLGRIPPDTKGLLGDGEPPPEAADCLAAAIREGVEAGMDRAFEAAVEAGVRAGIAAAEAWGYKGEGGAPAPGPPGAGGDGPVEALERDSAPLSDARSGPGGVPGPRRAWGLASGGAEPSESEDAGEEMPGRAGGAPLSAVELHEAA